VPLLRSSLLKAGAVVLVLAAGGCSHLVKVESKPIVIELHVKIDQDVRVQVEGEVPAVLLSGQTTTQMGGAKKLQAGAPDAAAPP
jgi:hypothetical protein